MADTATKQTAIVNYDPAAPLGRPTALRAAWDDVEVRAALVGAVRGEMTADERERCAQRVITEAILHIANSKARDKILRSVGASVVESLCACAGMGLSLSQAFKEAYLIPYSNICTLFIGYGGFEKLMVNTGVVTHLESVMLYEGDHWPVPFYRDEDGPHWKQEPSLEQQGDETMVVGCMGIAYRPKGPPIVERMNLKELNNVMASSQAVQKGVSPAYKFWRTEMYRKAPIRRMQKHIPKTGDNLAHELLARAIEHDNKQYDLDKIGEFQQAALDHSKSLREAAERALDGKEAPRPLPAPESPPGGTGGHVATHQEAPVASDPAGDSLFKEVAEEEDPPRAEDGQILPEKYR